MRSVLIGVLKKLYEQLAIWGMHGVFMTMLAAARSKRQLRELHEALDANCRLMRQDYLDLEAAWDQLYPQGYEVGPDAQTLACLLDTLRRSGTRHVRDRDLTGYYLRRLDAGQEKLDVRIAVGIQSTVFTCPQRKGYGDEHFTATLCGHEFQVAFKLTEDGQHIVVMFEIWEYDLTEPLVHALLNKLPKFQISSRRSSSSWGGVEVDLCYILERDGLQEHILLHDGKGEGVAVGGQCHLAQEGFIPEVLRRLTALDIPVEKIDPIMVAERRD